MSQSRRVLVTVLVVATVMYGGAWAVVGAQSGSKAPRGGNPDAAKVRNPVQATPESAAAGRRIYQRQCIRCHGPQGKGDGGGAGGGGLPADLSGAHWDFGGSDGEIFAAIHDGTSAEMEGYAERIGDTDIWNLVNYIRSFGPQKR